VLTNTCDNVLTVTCDNGLTETCDNELTETCDNVLTVTCGNVLTVTCDNVLTVTCDNVLTVTCDNVLTGDLGLTAVVYLNREPWSKLGPHLASFGFQVTRGQDTSGSLETDWPSPTYQAVKRSNTFLE
jgi:hypothetical protein